MNVVYNAKARTLSINEKTFGPEDVAMYNRMWVHEDGMDPGYVAPFNGTIEKITPKRVFFWGTKSITHERFAELNK